MIPVFESMLNVFGRPFDVNVNVLLSKSLKLLEISLLKFVPSVPETSAIFVPVGALFTSLILIENVSETDASQSVAEIVIVSVEFAFTSCAVKLKTQLVIVPKFELNTRF
jgi:hypothetical protein